MQSEDKTFSATDLDGSHWDAVIVGSGPAGAATAITLARSGRKVLVLEKRKQLRSSLGESIPPVAVDLVEHMLGKSYQEVLQRSVETQGNISIWGSDEKQVSDFYFTAKGHGLCVDRHYFDESLRRQAENAGALIARSIRLLEFKRDQTMSQWLVSIEQGSTKQVSASYLFDCSGRSSVVATQLGVKRQCHDGLFAFAQRLQRVAKTDLQQDTYTRIEATANGWWYSNELPQQQIRSGSQTSDRLMVFHTDRDHPLAKQMATTEGLMRACGRTDLAETLAQQQYRPVGKVQGAAASSERLTEFAGEGWLAVGDAAQSFDPLSSQGIYKAISSGCMAAQMVDYALQQSNNNEFYLKRYVHEQQRLWDDYVQQKDFYYASERRWSDQLFWQRRQRPNANSSVDLRKGAL